MKKQRERKRNFFSIVQTLRSIRDKKQKTGSVGFEHMDMIIHEYLNLKHI